MKTTSTTTYKRRTIESHVDALVHFIQILDHEMVFDLLDDRMVYQDMSRHNFVHCLADVFETFCKSGDYFLETELKVNGVYDGVKVLGYSFIGNNSRNYIDLMFEIDHCGYVQDIFEFEDMDEKIAPGKKEARLFLEDLAYFDNEEYDDYADEGDDGHLN